MKSRNPILNEIWALDWAGSIHSLELQKAGSQEQIDAGQGAEIWRRGFLIWILLLNYVSSKTNCKWSFEGQWGAQEKVLFQIQETVSILRRVAMAEHPSEMGSDGHDHPAVLVHRTSQQGYVCLTNAFRCVE